jgi:5-hydroxyisourate hydrolase
VVPGVYRIRFHTGAYFAARQQTGFFPVVEIQFTVDDGAQHYHVPLLLSPYGYSTYRGS